jgi:hypothetical protein
MSAQGPRRLEIDDAIRRQMNVRQIEEAEIDAVINRPEAESLVHRRGVPIEGRYLFMGSPSPGRRIEVECQLRADNGMYRVISIREL